MNSQSGNLSGTERAVSAGLATALSLLAVRSGSPIIRLLSGAAAIALAARAAAGQCGVKAALRDRTLHRENSAKVDEAVNESFPASDPPASRLPDEPPVNAEAKWAAARAAGLNG